MSQICVLLPRMIALGCFPPGTIALPTSQQVEMLKSFETLSKGSNQTEQDDHLVYTCFRYLELLEVAAPETHIQHSVTRHLIDMLESALVSTSVEPQKRELFAIGPGLNFVLRNRKTTDQLNAAGSSFLKACRRFERYPVFWETLLKLLTDTSIQLEVTDNDEEMFVAAALVSLASPSHELRLLSLQAVKAFYLRNGQAPDALETALLIESTPLGLITARSVSMKVRRLGQIYKESAADPLLKRLIPHYCFGMMHLKLAQVWDDVCVTLKEVCASREGENIVTSLTNTWIWSSPSPEAVVEDSSLTVNHTLEGWVAISKCPNIASSAERAAKNAQSLYDAKLGRQSAFNMGLAPVSLLDNTCRSQALRILHSIPWAAERNSRSVVPAYLCWAFDDEVDSVKDMIQMEGTGSKDDQETPPARWSRKEQKQLLTLFAKFTNPKVIYKSEKVYAATLKLLTSGDVEIQKSALDVIFTWKSGTLLRYRENLVNILDDARFREEITLFLDSGQSETTLHDEHRDEVMPVLLRLLYGKATARAGSSSGSGVQRSKRKAIFRALTRFGEIELCRFLGVSLGPLENIELVRNGQIDEASLNTEILSTRRQYGLLTMLEDMLDTISSQLTALASQIVHPVLYCMIRSSRASAAESPMCSSDALGNQLTLHKSIRQVGFHCLNIMLEKFPDLAWEPYRSTIIKELVLPRLETLPIDTAQSISGTLRLLSAFCGSVSLGHFLADDGTMLLRKGAECLAVPFAQPDVKEFVLSHILMRLIETTKGFDSIQASPDIDRPRKMQESVLKPNVNFILAQVNALVQQHPSKHLLDISVRAIAELSYFVSASSECESLVETSLFLLKQSPKRVSPHTKGDLLRILEAFCPMLDWNREIELRGVCFSILSKLFSFFKDRINRETLCRVFKVLGHGNLEVLEVAALCEDLNSFSPVLLDDPDFDRRLAAFNRITEENYTVFSAMQWPPILHNMLFFIKDDEVSLRTSAAFALRRFIDVASGTAATANDEFQELLTSILLPGLRDGCREGSEQIRGEYLGVLAHLVKCFPQWPAVNDLNVLLVGGDDEASFFTNILHIQHHRRLRALRRLPSEAAAGKFGHVNVSQILLPLVEHFIFDRAEGEAAQNLSAEAVKTVGVLALWVDWSTYRKLFAKYIKTMQQKPELVKPVVKLISLITDALAEAGERKGFTKRVLPNHEASQAKTHGESCQKLLEPQGRLADTIPSQSELSTDLTKNFLQKLTTYLRLKDEATVGFRTAIAVSVVKMLRLLPLDEYEYRLPSVLLDVTQVLKSRAQESRDLARNTLVEITVIIGPAYLGTVLKELRTVLQRGYQLHVLSFTVHSILLSVSETFGHGTLDYCLFEVVTLLMQDVFGASGHEKEAEDYVSSMKEVKSNKSLDSFEILTKICSLERLIDLLKPVQTLLFETLDQKTSRKVDELLRRLGLGILSNADRGDQKMLVFCYELLHDVHGTGATIMPVRTTREAVRGQRKTPGAVTNSSQLYKLRRFALELLRMVLQKEQELRTPQNLTGFIPVISDSLLDQHEEVRMSAIRLLAAIIGLNMPQLIANASIYVKEAVRIVKDTPSLHSEIAQAAIKFISVVLKERPECEIKETDLGYILQRAKLDIEMPDRQGLIFGFIKAVLDQKIVIPEIYDILDVTATIMITNHSQTARDHARRIFTKFLIDYPQTQRRLSKQLAFLVKNLTYEHVEGRQSVMEALHLLLSKTGEDIVQDILESVFAPLTLALVNDSSSECREMVAGLLKSVFERADSERVQSFVTLLRTWLGQEENHMLRRTALQCWTVFFEAKDPTTKDVTFVCSHIRGILATKQHDEEWQQRFYALQSLTRICQVANTIAFDASSREIWSNVRLQLTYHHAWVKLFAARLLGQYFADFARTQGSHGLLPLPLQGSGGLELGDQELVQVAADSIGVLNASVLSEELANQTAKNLMFVGRCFHANDVKWHKFSNGNNQEVELDSNSSGEDEASASDHGSVDGSALRHLFVQLSAVVRRGSSGAPEQLHRAAIASMRLIAGLCQTLPAPAILPALEVIMLPIYTLSHPSNVQAGDSKDEDHSLAEVSEEVMRILQEKFGITKYVEVFQATKDKVRRRREERKVKRRIETVERPEVAEYRKRRKHENTKRRRKEKGLEMRARRRQC